MIAWTGEQGTAVIAGICERLQIAWYVGDNFKPLLTIADYERVAERLAKDLGVPILAVENLLWLRT
jgi:hypothetical protein